MTRKQRCHPNVGNALTSVRTTIIVFFFRGRTRPQQPNHPANQKGYPLFIF